MNQEARKELAEQRKKELKERERLKDLHTDLSLKEEQAKIDHILGEEYNPYTVSLIIFFGTLAPLSIFYWCLKFILRFMFGPILQPVANYVAWLDPVVWILIFGVSLISVVRKKSLLEDYLFMFS